MDSRFRGNDKIEGFSMIDKIVKLDSHLHGNDRIRGLLMEIPDSSLHGNDKMNEKIKGVFSNLL